MTTFGLVAVLIVNLKGWSLGPRVEQATVIVSVMLIILAAVNAIFVAWATAIETRRPAALMKALGATPAQVAAGLSLAQLGPALVGALVGVAGPILPYLRGGRLSTVVPVLPLASIVVVTLIAIGVLTALTTLAASRGQVAEALEADAG